MDAYEEYALLHRRDVQCLGSSDRNVRKQALEKLSNPIHSEFFLQEAQTGVFRLFSDPVDRVRESAVALVAKLYGGSLGLTESTATTVIATLPTLLPLLSARLKAEASEEIKQQLLCLLQVVLRYAPQHPQIRRSVGEFSGEVLESVRQSLADACPDLKKLACAVVSDVTSVFALDRLRQNQTLVKSLVTALIGNFKHTHWRVRTASLSSLCVLLSLQAPGSALILDFTAEVLAFLPAMVHDRQAQVRRETFRSLGVWLCVVLALQGGVASMVDGQYVLVDTKREERFLQSLLFHLVLGLTDEDEGVQREAREALTAVATKKLVPAEAGVEAYVAKSRSLGVAEGVWSVWLEAEVATLLGHFKTGLVQQALTTPGVTRRALLVLTPWVVESLDAVVALLVMHSEDPEYTQLLTQTAVYAEYVGGILNKTVANYLSQQAYPLVNAALTVLHKLIKVAGLQCVGILEDCVKDSVPRGVLSGKVGLCAEALLSITSSEVDRIHSVLLRSETVACLTADIFTEAFFLREASRVSLPVLALLIARTSTTTIRPHLVASVLSRLVQHEDEAAKTEVLEVLDVVVKKLSNEQRPEEMQFIGSVIDQILMPYIEWRPGQANAKIRRGALVVLLGVVDLVPGVGAERTLVDYWPVFKSAMDDSWVPDNRYAAVIAVRKLMGRVQPGEHSSISQEASEGTVEIFRDMYPELLKRLDDSQDPVRVEAANAISVMFELIAALVADPQKATLLLSKSSVTYVVKALLVHLEDQNDVVWHAVEAAVVKAAMVCRQGVVEELKAGEVKSAKPQRCASILALI